MTFPGTVYEETPRSWGVGRIVVDGEITPWAVSRADVDGEAESLAPRLTALGLPDGGLLLIVSLLSQTIHVTPFEQAAGLVGARYSSADATPFDAFRTASLVKQLNPQVVLGVDAAVLDGLAELERPVDDVFAPVRTVVTADSDAFVRLTGAGLAPRRWVKLGPTSALQSPDGDALLYDAARWQVDVDPATNELLLTNVVERLTPCDRLRTGVHGDLIEPGRISLS